MRPEKPQQESVVTFHRVFTAAIPPLRADKSALGILPAAAFQYCEPVRTASAFGWYIFPPADIHLMWDGVDVYHAENGQWSPFSSIHLTEKFVEYWDSEAPEDLKGHAPPFLTNVFVPGIVQIWSGLLVSSAKNWSVLIGPVANIPQSQHFSCFEGLVETDSFKPCPLFVNIRLLTTDREIVIPKTKPLFQVKPVQRDCYSDATLKHTEYEGLSPRTEGKGSMSEEDWKGYRSTVRSAELQPEGRVPGSYGAARRRRAKREAE
jgi:Family of unknown function (DUF6065)